ncbi:cyclin-dependent kinase 2-associated protein 2 isoform X2 [Osmerus eperlanus]|uniref:cyclin-dependent kinase 2-associated protein 2 isoform X2 n=1 Tax=Osmerus eperlanus TaxID=29151 RepID=UPI002E14E3AC
MSYKPIAPAPSGSNHTPPGSSVPSPSLPSSSNFRPAFSDFGPPSMGFVQPVKVSQGSTYSELLSVIEEMSREIRPTYAGSKSAMERLKRETIAFLLGKLAHGIGDDRLSTDLCLTFPYRICWLQFPH